MFIQILAILGILLSSYALYVKGKAESDKSYIPLCDINKHISCTRAFLSREGSMTGLPNPLLGIIFYALIFLFDVMEYRNALWYLSLIALAGSLYLADVSYVRQKNFCLVCTAIYIINFLLVVVQIPSIAMR